MQPQRGRASGWVPRYLGTIGEIELLDREREHDLAVRVRSGRDPAARDRLILANLRFAFSICRQYQGFGLSLEDLVAEAHVGLIEAADRFDPERCVRFISYATFWIRRAIYRALMRHSSHIAIPQRKYARFRAARESRRMLAARYGRDPNDEELAAALGISVDEVREKVAAPIPVVSLDDPVVEGGDSSRAVRSGSQTEADPESSLRRSESLSLVRWALRSLSTRERFVLECRYGLQDETPMSLSEVSRCIGVSREMVRQIESRARRKMHHRIRWRHRAPNNPIRSNPGAVAPPH